MYLNTDFKRLRYRACLLGLVVLALMVTAEALVGNSSESSFCTETKECLLYDPLCMAADYEERHYNSTKWVSTEEKCRMMEIAIIKAVRRLHKYFTGTNEDGVKLDMTAPMMVRMQNKAGTFSPSVYTVSFLLPSAYQESPPTPIDPELYFTHMPDMDVYVMRFGGWMNSLAISYYSHSLKKDLDRAQASYRKLSHYVLGYDGPMKIFNRHNEICHWTPGNPRFTTWLFFHLD
ncbi:hypothetical protein AAFF_G00122870 [Aldrovandia affinis]|uniref:Heme-binding protein 1 n=1 Tax=Aldrovandia affinis TaxID=143900 RepID=A0AAD7W9N8_9TELE|nr:hypothetical protein AAFF_G00122870 [Aldrovandia affinis]